jgi:hypothetical protein
MKGKEVAVLQSDVGRNRHGRFHLMSNGSIGGDDFFKINLENETF